MVNRTRRDIVEAFRRLIAKQEIDQFTSMDIAKEAGVSKATFYRYFKDKYDVMNYNYKELLDGCLEKCRNYRDLFYMLFHIAQTEWKPLRKAFHSTGVNSFANYIYTYSMTVADEITRQNRSGSGFTPEETFQIDVFCHGISYMYNKWTNGQYNIPAQKAADLLYAMAPDSLKHYWFVQNANGPQESISIEKPDLNGRL